MSEKNTVTITDNSTGKTADFPIMYPTHGTPVINISGIAGKFGYFTHDPGYTATSACRSAITYIDGDKGVLLYRGYPIEQLAQHSSFLEVCYLLFYGELPTQAEWEKFRQDITTHTMVHEGITDMLQGYRRGAHPMSMLVGLIGALSSFYHDSLDISSREQRLLCAYRLVAKTPTIASYTYKYAIGQPVMHPDNSLDFVENFLRMMFGVPTEPYKASPVHARALELMMILHADHEQNASTSTVRLSGSSGANPFAAVAAGIATLWGPSHGGANEAVLHMLAQIKSPRDISGFLEKAKNSDDPTRLMGFGHRVYKNFDPRAKIIRQVCHDLLEELGTSANDPTFEVALRLEEIARSDDYFIKRNLYPNVDFYSGIILKALGIPLNMFTVMFAIARTVGWISQWLEMLEDEDFKIGRPRQLYIGAPERQFVEMSKR